jgi:hypothetical protein
MTSLGWLEPAAFPGWRWWLACASALPERRHPPPAEDDGARLARRVRRAGAAAATSEPYNLFVPLALPIVWHLDYRLSEFPYFYLF